MGISMEPSEEVSATAEPEMPPKNMEARMLTCARPPRIHPTQALASVMSRREIPPWPMISPAKIKNGIASSEKDCTPFTIR